MIEKRLVQWYAADAGVDLDIAEREIVLTYVLRVLTDSGLLASLAFKGGTAIRKLYSTGQGRFSLDLDFTAVGEVDPEAFILEVVGVLHEHTHYGLTFAIPAADYYATPESCGAEVRLSPRVDDQRSLRIADQFSRCATVAGAAHPIAVRALLRVAGD